MQAPGGPRTHLAQCLLPLWPGSPSPGAWGHLPPLAVGQAYGHL